MLHYMEIQTKQIMNLYEGKPYKVYLGNEEVGDPEVTD